MTSLATQLAQLTVPSSSLRIIVFLVADFLPCCIFPHMEGGRNWAAAAASLRLLRLQLQLMQLMLVLVGRRNGSKHPVPEGRGHTEAIVLQPSFEVMIGMLLLQNPEQHYSAMRQRVSLGVIQVARGKI